MFERFTEKARRVIFFARYHASQFGSSYIASEHLLLGVIAEDRVLAARLRESQATPESVRNLIQSRTPARHKLSTSVDLPLDQDSRRALAFAAEEAEALQHTVIDTGHLILGLLRIESCLASAILQEHGIDYAGYLELVRASPQAEFSLTQVDRPGRARPVERATDWEEAEPAPPAAPSLAGPITALKRQVVLAVEHMDTYSEAYGEQRLKRKPWSRKEALGHLVNLAMAHHEWLARALTEPKLAAAGYPQEDWTSAQQYHKYSWLELIELWISMNRLLVHILAAVPEEKVNMPCRIGIEEPRTLLALIERYVDQCEDLIAQILARL